MVGYDKEKVKAFFKNKLMVKYPLQAGKNRAA